MKARIGRILAGAMAFTVATTMATTGNASAAIVWDHTYKASGVKVQVKEHGDIVRVCDTSTNGHAGWLSVAYYDSFGNRRRYTATAKIKGRCVTHQASEGGVYDLSEKGFASGKVVLTYDGDGTYDAVSSFINDH